MNFIFDVGKAVKTVYVYVLGAVHKRRRHILAIFNPSPAYPPHIKREEARTPKSDLRKLQILNLSLDCIWSHFSVSSDENYLTKY